jgi:DNA-binding NtrC family response regulator
MNKILLVEDQSHHRAIVKAQLESHRYAVDEALNLRMAVEKLNREKYDVIVLDLKLPDGNSIQLFDRFPGKLAARTIIITANATIPSVVEAIKKGAFNYLEKPVDEGLLIAQVQKVVQLNQLQNGYQSLKKEVFSNYTFEDIIYKSEQMANIIDRARVLAQTDNTILIQGETGVG